MADPNQTTYTIKLAGDVEDVKKGIDVASQTVASLGHTVDKVVTSINTQFSTATASIKLFAASADQAQKLIATLNEANTAVSLRKRGDDGKVNSDILSSVKQDPSSTKGDQRAADKVSAAEQKEMLLNMQRLEKEYTQAVGTEYKRRNSLFIEGLREAELKQRSAIATEKAIALEGANSITALKMQQVEKERQLQRSLATQLNSVQANFAAGDINYIQQAAQRNAALASTEAAILRLNATTLSRITAIREVEAAERLAAEAQIARQAALQASAERARNAPINRNTSFTGVGGLGQQAVQPAIPPVPSEVIQSHRSLALRILESIGLYQLFTGVISNTWNALRAIPKIGIELDSTKASLEATVGAGARAGSAIAALNEEAQRTGINITVLRESFRGFQASTSLAGESLSSTWKMFTNLNTVITGLHLSADKANGIFLAMAQIFNKGKVQSEELVKQLGNLLPGAFASFATATGRSTMQLAQDMKKGMVYAHNEVEAFTNYLAERFQVSFELASQALNSNIGRMQTSFSHLGEAIYASTSGSMNSFVKQLTALGDYLTGAVTGANNFGAVLKGVFDIAVGIAVASLAKMVLQAQFVQRELLALEAGATLASRGMLALSTVTTAFAASGPAAILTAVTAMAMYLHQLKAAAQDTHDSIQAAFDVRDKKQEAAKSPEAAIKFRVGEDPAVKIAKENLANTNAGIAEFERTHGKERAFLESENDKIKQLRIDQSHGAILLAEAEANARMTIGKEENISNIAILQERYKDQADAEQAAFAHSKNLTTVLKKAESDYNEKFAANRQRQQALIAAGSDRPAERYLPERKATDEQKAQAIEAKKVLDNIDKGWEAQKLHDTETFNKALALENNKGAAAALKEHKQTIRAGYIDEVASIQSSRGDIDSALKQIDDTFANHNISISAYFAKRQQLQAEDIRLQHSAVNAELSTAFAEKDKVKIAQLNKQNADIDKKAKSEETQSQIALTKATQQYQDVVKQINSESVNSKGKAKESALQAFDDAHKNAVRMLQAEAAIDDEIAKKTLETNALNRAGVGVQAELNALLLKEKIIKEDLKDNEQLILDDVKLGIKTQLQGAWEIGQARQAALASLQQNVTEQKKLQGVPGSNPQTDQTIRKSIAGMKIFGQEADVVGNKFKTIFTENFTNGFTAFVTGAANAKQAFASFATGVVQNIAKIVAEEASSQILKMVLGAAFSGVGAGFSGAANGSNVSSNASFIGPVQSANGNLFSGGDIVPFSKGGIPDSGSNYQTFPMSGGKTGSLREKGPEFIMPASRDAFGQLGVKANLSGIGGNQTTNIINVTVSNDGKQTADQLGTKVADAAMRAIAKQEISNASRPGNQLNRTTKVA